MFYKVCIYDTESKQGRFITRDLNKERAILLLHALTCGPFSLLPNRGGRLGLDVTPLDYFLRDGVYPKFC